MRVCVLTTSYPRYAGDMAGKFVQDAVEHLRERGVVVEVVSPASFRHFGIAYGHGIANNLRLRPWRLLLLPAFLIEFARAARRGARDADIVAAHWLPSIIPALITRRPIAVHLWGSDVALAARVPRLARFLLRRSALVVCPSGALAEDARRLGAPNVRVIPPGIDIPLEVGAPDDPPHVLYLGRLSAEKGVAELAEAARGLPLVVVGDGPLRKLFPNAIGFVPHSAVSEYLSRAAIVVCPSRREGYGFTCAEAMAHGRPVIASAVGGLEDHIEDGVTGALVPAEDPESLRRALERLLADPGLRLRMGAAARERARARLSWEAASAATVEAYAVLSPSASTAGQAVPDAAQNAARSGPS